MSTAEEHESEQRFSLLAVIGLLACVAGLGSFTFYFYQNYQFEKLPDHAKLQKFWVKDMMSLQKAGKLPKEFNDIQKIKYFTGTPKAKNWLKHLQAPVSLKKDGKYTLEILIVSWEDGPQRGAMIQYDVVDTKTENLIHEFGRTFLLNGQGLKKQVGDLQKWVNSFPLLKSSEGAKPSTRRQQETYPEEEPEIKQPSRPSTEPRAQQEQPAKSN